MGYVTDNMLSVTEGDQSKELSGIDLLSMSVILLTRHAIAVIKHARLQ